MTSANPYRIMGVGKEIISTSGEMPERDLLWWGVTRGSLLYAALGKSPAQAMLSVSDVIGITVDELELVPYFVEEYPEDAQQELIRKFGERKAVRLLPFSLVEWPQDMNNLTSEQMQHGIHTGWLDEDGNFPK